MNSMITNICRRVMIVHYSLLTLIILASCSGPVNDERNAKKALAEKLDLEQQARMDLEWHEKSIVAFRRMEVEVVSGTRANGESAVGLFCEIAPGASLESVHHNNQSLIVRYSLPEGKGYHGNDCHINDLLKISHETHAGFTETYQRQRSALVSGDSVVPTNQAEQKGEPVSHELGEGMSEHAEPFDDGTAPVDTRGIE